MRIKRKMLPVLLALTIVFVMAPMVPGSTGTAYAESEAQPAVSLGAEMLQEKAGKADAPTIFFGGYQWRVIHYGGTQYLTQTGAPKDGCMTLLSSANLGWTALFPNTIFEPYNYAQSALRAEIDTIADGIPEGEKACIVPGSLSDNIGDPVTDALLWPLSEREADINRELLKSDNSWWLRTPGLGNLTGQYYDMDKGWVEDQYCEKESGIRPAFHLDISKVLFTSAAETGKWSGGLGLDTGADALREVGTAGGNEWKFTVRDTNHSGFTVDPSQTEYDGKALTVSYSGAVCGKNEYISAVIVDSKGDVTYYGRIAGTPKDTDESGTVTVNIGGRMSRGDKLYIFNEQFNGDTDAYYNTEAKTDLASELQEIAIPVSGAQVSGLSDATYTGSAIIQTPKVKLFGRTLKAGADYELSFKDNTNAGTASVIIAGTGSYTGTVIRNFRIGKAANTLAVKPKTATVKYSKVKKKAQTVNRAKVITISKAQGGQSYNFVSAKKGKKNFRKYFKVNAKTGNVTVKKGLKKGTYKVNVRVKAAGNANYNASAWKTVTFTVNVK